MAGRLLKAKLASLKQAVTPAVPAHGEPPVVALTPLEPAQAKLCPPVATDRQADAQPASPPGEFKGIKRKLKEAEQMRQHALLGCAQPSAELVTPLAPIPSVSQEHQVICTGGGSTNSTQIALHTPGQQQLGMAEVQQPARPTSAEPQAALVPVTIVLHPPAQMDGVQDSQGMSQPRQCSSSAWDQSRACVQAEQLQSMESRAPHAPGNGPHAPGSDPGAQHAAQPAPCTPEVPSQACQGQASEHACQQSEPRSHSAHVSQTAVQALSSNTSRLKPGQDLTPAHAGSVCDVTQPWAAGSDTGTGLHAGPSNQQQAPHPVGLQGGAAGGAARKGISASESVRKHMSVSGPATAPHAPQQHARTDEFGFGDDLFVSLPSVATIKIEDAARRVKPATPIAPRLQPAGCSARQGMAEPASRAPTKPRGDAQGKIDTEDAGSVATGVRSSKPEAGDQRDSTGQHSRARQGGKAKQQDLGRKRPQSQPAAVTPTLGSATQAAQISKRQRLDAQVMVAEAQELVERAMVGCSSAAVPPSASLQAHNSLTWSSNLTEQPDNKRPAAAAGEVAAPATAFAAGKPKQLGAQVELEPSQAPVVAAPDASTVPAAGMANSQPGGTDKQKRNRSEPSSSKGHVTRKGSTITPGTAGKQAVLNPGPDGSNSAQQTPHTSSQPPPSLEQTPSAHAQSTSQPSSNSQQGRPALIGVAHTISSDQLAAGHPGQCVAVIKLEPSSVDRFAGTPGWAKVVQCILELSSAAPSPASSGLQPRVMASATAAVPVNGSAQGAGGAYACSNARHPHASLDLAGVSGFGELWSQLTHAFSPVMLPSRLSARLVYLDSDGDWLLVTPDEQWDSFVRSARKLLVSPLH